MLQENIFTKPYMRFVLLLIPVFLTIPLILMLGFLRDNASRQEEIAVLKDEVVKLQSKIEILENEREKISSLEKEAEDLREKVAEYEKELEVRDSKIRGLEEKNAAYEETLKDMEEKLKLYGVAGITGNENQKVAYLTFDDGPSKNTDKVLDILKKYGIKATFFVIGNENMKDKYKRILDEGHAIGNHTYSHDYSKIYSSVEAFFEDFDKLNSLLKEYTGQTTEIFRFPGGSHNTVSNQAGGSEIIHSIVDEASKRGYKYFDWNVSSGDASVGGGVLSKDTIVNNVLSTTRNRKSIIVLMHDTAAKDTTVEALPEIIEGLAAQGYKFGVLSKYLQKMK